MSGELSEKEERVLASYVKSLAYAAPEERRGLAEDFAKGLLECERRRVAGRLEDVLLKGGAQDWRSRLLEVVTKLTRGEL